MKLAVVHDFCGMELSLPLVVSYQSLTGWCKEPYSPVVAAFSPMECGATWLIYIKCYVSDAHWDRTLDIDQLN